MNTEKIKNYILNQEMGEESKRLYDLVYTLEVQYKTLLNLWSKDQENEYIKSQLDLVYDLINVLGGLSDEQ